MAINKPTDGKCGYKAFYNGRSIELYADTSLQAQERAAAFFKVKKAYKVTVGLCEIEGQQVTHVAVD